MTNHFTLRMVWHDNKWDGNICQDPENNFYCTAARSVLSERIARKKEPKTEAPNKGKRLDTLLPNYLPPCYWSSAAFSPEIHTVIHNHPFQRYEETKKIEEKLGPYSSFSWPFRLSFTHSPSRKKAMGDYQKDLPERIGHFISKFEPQESVVFFYLNYDNPISGDEEKYALVGCAVVSRRPDVPPDFDFPDDELEKIREPHRMKHFPTMNWAMQIFYDFEKTGIRLPYHEYLEYVREHPEERQKLEEMRVLIEEDSLVFGFKYVLADINEDQCIFLLTKLRKSIDVIQEHGIVDFSREQKLINQLLERAWKRRGLYPGLSTILEYTMEDDSWKAESLVGKLQANTSSSEDLCKKTFSLLLHNKVPKYLKELEDEVRELQKNFSQHTSIMDLLKKLSLFSLKKKQIDNIITRNKESFAREVNTQEIIRNPYVLCEEYQYELTQEDLDKEEIDDDAIDLFKIDIGMFPEKYVKGNSRLQNLAPASAERLRAVIIDYLCTVGAQGDCYSVIEDVYDNILDNPLFYKRELRLTKDQLISEPYVKHFSNKLALVENEDRNYFYLKEVVRAEEIVRETVTTLLEREDYPTEIKEVESFVRNQAKELKDKGVKCFDEKLFLEERTKVLQNILKKSFYVISGKPGTGKTKILEKIIHELGNDHEEVTVVAPTGKASLRLKLDSKAKQAQTIDRFIYSDKNGYSKILENFAAILEKGRKYAPIENLIIDESSMIDLQKLAALFSMLKLIGENKVKRIIMVGDENQLPPIGFGRPFYDIIQYVKFKPKYRESNYVKLLTNCRNELDPKIIEFADVFAGKNRYYNELLDKIVKGEGDVSEGLAIEKWNDPVELQEKIDNRLDKIIRKELTGIDLSGYDKLGRINLLFGLYDNGYVKEGEMKEGKPLAIDNFQMITPYRTERHGSMALSEFFKANYPRGHWSDSYFRRAVFNHSDKIIRLTNEYIYDYRLEKRVLRLSNGSMGIVNNKKDKEQRRYYRKYFFTDQEHPLYNKGYASLKEDEDFELAYAITVHKSQGSDFGNVFLIVPTKRSLLSKELLYTALTRSKRSTTVFLQKEKGREILEDARNHSTVLERNTSIFEPPENAKEIFEPIKGKHVKSKIEYILYKALEASGLKFEYEEPLFLEKGPEKIKPDFTVYANGRTYYWEHLGELDLKQYWSDWMARRDWYKANGKYESLITTDDLGGVKQGKILKVFEDLSKGIPEVTAGSEFSNHHYKLYDN
jgi:ATP-dependent exoDNAse (exonuclease V) alpha subunit